MLHSDYIHQCILRLKWWSLMVKSQDLKKRLAHAAHAARCAPGLGTALRTDANGQVPRKNRYKMWELFHSYRFAGSLEINEEKKEANPRNKWKKLDKGFLNDDEWKLASRNWSCSGCNWVSRPAKIPQIGRLLDVTCIKIYQNTSKYTCLIICMATVWLLRGYFYG